MNNNFLILASILGIVFFAYIFLFSRNRENIDKVLVMEKIKGGALIVDVRTPAEFATGHYKGSINIPLNEIESRIKEFGKKNKPIIVYCRSGNRSAKAQAILLNHGFKDVTNGGGLKDMNLLNE